VSQKLPSPSAVQSLAPSLPPSPLYEHPPPRCEIETCSTLVQVKSIAQLLGYDLSGVRANKKREVSSEWSEEEEEEDFDDDEMESVISEEQVSSGAMPEVSVDSSLGLSTSMQQEALDWGVQGSPLVGAGRVRSRRRRQEARQDQLPFEAYEPYEPYEAYQARPHHRPQPPHQRHLLAPAHARRSNQGDASCHNESSVRRKTSAEEEEEEEAAAAAAAAVVATAAAREEATSAPECVVPKRGSAVQRFEVEVDGDLYSDAWDDDGESRVGSEARIDTDSLLELSRGARGEGGASGGGDEGRVPTFKMALSEEEEEGRGEDREASANGAQDALEDKSESGKSGGGFEWEDIDLDSELMNAEPECGYSQVDMPDSRDEAHMGAGTDAKAAAAAEEEDLYAGLFEEESAEARTSGEMGGGDGEEDAGKDHEVRAAGRVEEAGTGGRVEMGGGGAAPVGCKTLVTEEEMETVECKREEQRLMRTYLHHMSLNIPKYQDFLSTFHDHCSLALQKKLRYSRINTQMGPMTLPEIAHNYHSTSGRSLATDFPEIDKLPDHPDREVLFVDNKLAKRVQAYKERLRGYYSVLRRRYAHKLERQADGKLVDLGLKYPSIDPRIRRQEGILLLSTPSHTSSAAAAALEAARGAPSRHRRLVGSDEGAGKEAKLGRALMYEMAALGTSSEALAVRRRQDEEANRKDRTAAAGVVFGQEEEEEVGLLLRGRDVHEVKQERHERLMALIDNSGKQRPRAARRLGGDEGGGAERGYRREGMQMVAYGGQSEESSAGKLATKSRRKALADEAYSKVLQTFEQNVFMNTGDTLEDALVPEKGRGWAFDSEVEREVMFVDTLVVVRCMRATGLSSEAVSSCVCLLEL
jgi:hypothetical protein